MLEENKVGFNLMYSLRCAVDSDNVPQIKKIFTDHPYLAPDSYFHGGCSTLHYACSKGSSECVTYFLSEFKSDPNSINCQYGMTPAHMAAIHGKFSIISLLQQFGTNLFQSDNEGQNILHKAITYGDLDFIKALLTEFKLNSLLVQGDHKNLRPCQFLKDLLSKGMHPKQLSRESEDENLSILLNYLNQKTEDFLYWDTKKYFLQIRYLVKWSIIN